MDALHEAITWLDISLTVGLLVFIVASVMTLRRAVRDLGEYNRALTGIVREHMVGRVIIVKGTVQEEMIVERGPVEPADDNISPIRREQ